MIRKIIKQDKSVQYIDKPVVLVDLDDTLTWFVPEWLKWLNNKYGCHVQYEDVREWDFSYLYPTLTAKQMHEPLGLPEFWKSVKIREDAKLYLKELYDCGFEIFLCTATYYKDIAMKYDIIIKEHFPFIDWSHVIVTKDKHMIKGDYLIDDYENNLIDGDYDKILLTVPRNKSFNAESHGIKRCSDWSEIKEYIMNVELTKDLSLPF